MLKYIKVVDENGRKIGEYNPESFVNNTSGLTFYRASRKRGKEFGSLGSIEDCINWIKEGVK